MKFSENLGTDASKWDCHTSSVWVTLGFGGCLFIRLIHHKSHWHLSENLFEETFIDKENDSFSSSVFIIPVTCRWK